MTNEEPQRRKKGGIVTSTRGKYPYYLSQRYLLRVNPIIKVTSNVITVALCIQCLSYPNQIGISCVMHSSPQATPSTYRHQSGQLV